MLPDGSRRHWATPSCARRLRLLQQWQWRWQNWLDSFFQIQSTFIKNKVCIELGGAGVWNDDPGIMAKAPVFWSMLKPVISLEPWLATYNCSGLVMPSATGVVPVANGEPAIGVSVVLAKSNL